MLVISRLRSADGRKSQAAVQEIFSKFFEIGRAGWVIGHRGSVRAATHKDA